MSAEPILLEVCVGSVRDAIAAFELGTNRIELNAALSLGGLTPTPTTVASVRSAIDCDLIVMNRPRSGNFRYDELELDVMVGDVEWMVQGGVQGVAFGCLTAQGTIDRAATVKLVGAIGDSVAVFHRAFDMVKDPLLAMEELIDCGVARILTSGGRSTAVEGAEALARLQDKAAGRIEILPAAGIRPDNVRTLVEQTGCDQVHASLSKVISDLQPIDNAAQDFDPIRFVDDLAIDESKWRQFDPAAMRAMLESIGRT